MDHITLKDQGPFHDNLKLKIESDQFTIISTDDKWSKFSSGAWGQGRFKNALGLTKEHMSKLRDLVRSQLILKYRV